MQRSSHIRRYVLVPGQSDASVRRFSLARVAVSPRSALGVDRLERLEQVAWPELDHGQNGSEPEQPQ